jgi:hypothetical protein
MAVLWCRYIPAGLLGDPAWTHVPLSFICR